MKLIDLNSAGGIGANSLYVQIGDFHVPDDRLFVRRRADRITERARVECQR